jgi:predicted transcriptional regulator
MNVIDNDAEMVEMKLRIMSKLHVNRDRKHGLSFFTKDLRGTINQICDAIESLEKEKLIIIHQQGAKTKIGLSKKGKQNPIPDIEVERLKKEFKALNEQDKLAEENARRLREQRLNNKLVEPGKGRRRILIVTPEGERKEISNLSKFCRDNNLSIGSMYKVSYGEMTSHKGYRVE